MIKKQPRLSIVIPAYNEEKSIIKTLDSYLSFFDDAFKEDYEIVVIPNNCSDNTEEIVEKYSRKFMRVRLKVFKEKIGKGGAIIEGFKIARGGLIGFVDADLATSPSAFYDLVENIKENDGIIASRWIKGAKIGKKQPLSRRIASRGFNFLVKLLFGLKLRDTQCGAKLFKRKAVEYVIDKLGITKWAFDIDLLYLLNCGGFKVVEIPSEWNEPGESHLNLKKTVLEMFLSVARLRLIYSPFKFVVNIYDTLISKSRKNE